MNYSEVRDLLNAGFTADEIREMLNPQNPQNNPQSENPNIEKIIDNNHPEKSENHATDQLDPVQDPGAAAVEKPNNDTEMEKRFNALNETMTKLIKTIQVSNLTNNSIPTNPEADINKKVDSIMASLIRPEHEKGE